MQTSKLPLTYYDYFRLVYLKSHDYKEFLRQVDKYEVKVKNQDFKEAEHPRDEDGKFSEKEEGASLPKEIQDKINSVNIDFSKDNILPELNEDDLKELGIEKSKKILLKKSIIDRNLSEHKEVKPEDYNRIIKFCLYSPELIFKGNESKPYFNFITRLERDNSGVILEIENTKEYFEIVHIIKLRDKSVRSIIKRDKKD